MQSTGSQFFKNLSNPKEILFVNNISSHHGHAKLKHLTPELILKDFKFNDPVGSEKKFNSISSIQYAVWVGNPYLLEQLLSFLHNEDDKGTALRQIVEARNAHRSNLPSTYLADFNLTESEHKSSQEFEVKKENFFKTLPDNIKHDIYKSFIQEKKKIKKSITYIDTCSSYGDTKRIRDPHMNRLLSKPFKSDEILMYCKGLKEIKELNPLIKIDHANQLKIESIQLNLEKQIQVMQHPETRTCWPCIKF